MAKIPATAAAITAGLIILQNTLIFAAPVNLTLQQSIDIALKNNPVVQIAGKDQEQSKWSISEAKAAKLPTVSLGSNYNFRDDSGDNSNSLRLNWQLYNGDRTDARIAQAQLGLAGAKLETEKTKQQLILQTTTDYYNVLKTKAMLNVNEQTVDNLAAHLAVVQDKYNAGVVAKSDLLRAEVELANARQNLIMAQNQYDLAVTGLLNTMNIEANTEINLDDDLTYEAYSGTLEEAIALANQNRPEIAKANVTIESAQKGVKIAESGKMPEVSLSASTGWQDSLLPNGANDWSLGVSASWNIFDAGVTNAQINQAEVALDKAKLQSEQVQDSVEQEVRESYLGMKEAEKRLETTEFAVNKANEDLYIAQERYKAGVGTNLDVIDAQLAYTQARTNHVKALYDYNINKAKLNKATGVKPGEVVS